MATAGLKPVVAIYSTFLQRAFDQLNSRCGHRSSGHLCSIAPAIVGADGPHPRVSTTSLSARRPQLHGGWPPKDEAELQSACLVTLGFTTNGPCALAAFPAGEGEACPLPEEKKGPFGGGGPPGAGDRPAVRQLADGDDLLIVAYGAMVAPAWPPVDCSRKTACGRRSSMPRFLRPRFDQDLICLARAQSAGLADHGRRSLPGVSGAAVVEASTHEVVWWPVLRIGSPAGDHTPSPDQRNRPSGSSPAPDGRTHLQRFRPWASSAAVGGLSPQLKQLRCQGGWWWVCGPRPWRAGQGSLADNSAGWLLVRQVCPICAAAFISAALGRSGPRAVRPAS